MSKGKEHDWFICDVCGTETAACLTLCPDCNNRKQGALDELERQKKELIENIIPMEKVRIKECEEHQIKSLSQFHKENLFYENVILKGIELRIKELEGGVEK